MFCMRVVSGRNEDQLIGARHYISLHEFTQLPTTVYRRWTSFLRSCINYMMVRKIAQHSPERWRPVSPSTGAEVLLLQGPFPSFTVADWDFPPRSWSSADSSAVCARGPGPAAPGQARPRRYTVYTALARCTSQLILWPIPPSALCCRVQNVAFSVLNGREKKYCKAVFHSLCCMEVR